MGFCYGDKRAREICELRWTPGGDDDEVQWMGDAVPRTSASTDAMREVDCVDDWEMWL